MQHTVDMEVCSCVRWISFLWVSFVGLFHVGHFCVGFFCRCQEGLDEKCVGWM